MSALRDVIMADCGGGFFAAVHCAAVARGSRLRWSYEHDQWMLVLDRW